MKAQYILLVILGVEITIGSLGNGFIAVVNIMDWVKRRKMSSVDQLFTALAISRLAFMWSLLTVSLINERHSSFMKTEKMLRILSISWTVVNHFNIWLATCLSIFYFLKIANFSNSIFLFLKWRVRKVVSGTLLASLLFLFMNSIVVNTLSGIWSDDYNANMSYSSHSNNYMQLSMLPLLIITVFTFIPFTVSLVSFLLLIFSLWRHLKNMQLNSEGSRDSSTTAHIRALHMMVAFLLLYTIFFLALVIHFWENEIWQENLFNLPVEDTALAFPSIHSCVLILGNTKLRQAFLSMLRWLRPRLYVSEHPSS
ncbi:taste receptor type 2 member 140-like [Psammomys obesus]|uniref:taste receptor type 2 member 140-like n=1 Tax=Psammomys obesus TaxID=48139 RepID=UPI002453587A|nr:taste receptor type 2 member 140-like [Psammomys obesus]